MSTRPLHREHLFLSNIDALNNTKLHSVSSVTIYVFEAMGSRSHVPLNIRKSRSADSITKRQISPPPSPISSTEELVVNLSTCVDQCVLYNSRSTYPTHPCQDLMHNLAHTDRSAFYFDQHANSEPRIYHDYQSGFVKNHDSNCKPMTTLRPASPHVVGMSLNLTTTSDDLSNNHRIFAIDELSEASGRSDALLENERQKLLEVQQILSHQERQAVKGRPVSRREQHPEHRKPKQQPKEAHKFKNKTREESALEADMNDCKIRTCHSMHSQFPSESPPYGFVDPTPYPTGRRNIHKCRIVIPNMQANNEPEHSERIFDAYIFDLDMIDRSNRSVNIPITANMTTPVRHKMQSKRPNSNNAQLSNDGKFCCTTSNKSSGSHLRTTRQCSIDVDSSQRQNPSSVDGFSVGGTNRVPSAFGTQEKARSSTSVLGSFEKEKEHVYSPTLQRRLSTASDLRRDDLRFQLPHSHSQRTRSQAVAPCKTKTTCCGLLGFGSSSSNTFASEKRHHSHRSTQFGPAEHDREYIL